MGSWWVGGWLGALAGGQEVQEQDQADTWTSFMASVIRVICTTSKSLSRT
jgi:hypothetical protein